MNYDITMYKKIVSVKDKKAHLLSLNLISYGAEKQ